MESIHNFDYNKLIQDYGGKCILIRGGKIIFADISTKVVIEYATTNFPDKKWKISRIDSGDAALYGINISHKTTCS